jgi:hypothetical protein
MINKLGDVAPSTMGLLFEPMAILIDTSDHDHLLIAVLHGDALHPYLLTTTRGDGVLIQCGLLARIRLLLVAPTLWRGGLL